jgi:hypothetical protein
MPGPEQRAHADGGFDRPRPKPARLGDAEVQRRVGRFGQLLVGRDGEEHVGGLHRNLVIVEAEIIEDARMVQRAFHHRVRAWLAIFLQQVPLQAAAIDADPDGTAIGAGRVHDFLHPRLRPDIAGIDPQAGRARIGGLDAAFVVEMDVGHDRHGRGPADLRHGGGRLFRRAGDAHDIGAGLCGALDLRDGCGGVLCRRVGHGLHGDGGIPADQNVTDTDLPGLAPRDVTPWTDRIVAHVMCLWCLMAPRWRVRADPAMCLQKLQLP